METKTTKELAEKAIEKITPIAKREKTAIKSAIENVALLTTLITIGAYVVMYAYKGGYCLEFSLPSTCIRVSLKDYLPLLFQICGFSLYILWYVSYIKSDKALARQKINGYRVLYGSMLVYWTLRLTNIQSLCPKYTSFPISIAIAFFVELIILLVRKNRTKNKDRAVSKAEQPLVLEEMISGFFFRRYFIKTGVFILVVLVSLAPILGLLIAKGNDDYQIARIDNVLYAVILDYGDSFIAQKARETDTSFEINTSSYIFFQKDGVEFEYKTFDHITKVKEFSNDNEENSEMTIIPYSDG